jgi:hypothetical protein
MPFAAVRLRGRISPVRVLFRREKRVGALPVGEYRMS